MKKPPLGVKVFGILFILYGTYWICEMLIFNLFGKLRAAPQAFISFLILGTGVICLMALILGIGLLLLKNWARWLTLLCQGYVTLSSMVLAPHNIVAHGCLLACWFSLGALAIWTTLVFWYFLRPAVKAQFKSA